MIEPVGGRTGGYPRSDSIDTHTFYPNGSNYLIIDTTLTDMQGVEIYNMGMDI